MKIGFTSKGTDWDSQMDPRFGRTEFILVYDEEKDELTHMDNSAIAQEAHGAGPQTAKVLFDMGAKVLITGNGPGGNAETILEKTGITSYVGAGDMTVKKAYESYKNDELKKI
ncbi:MAG: NifB/NifX family molybdenum-iron cluster-binding protein [Bacteroidota bacterium]